MLRVPIAALLAFVLAGTLFFARLGGLPLIDPDEGRNAGVAWEMKESGAWLVPSYNGLPYLDKPAAFFKAVAVSFRLFGRNEAAARLPSALSALMLAGIVYAFSRRFYGTRTAALAVLVVSSIPLYLVFARYVIFDMPLALFTSGSIFAVFMGEESQGRARRYWHVAGAAAAAAGTLIKGPVGFIVPGLVNLAVHVFRSRGSRAADSAGWLAPRDWGFLRRAFAPLNLLVFFGVTLAWFVAVLHRRPDFAYYGLVEETVRRYSTASFRRTAPFYYYAIVVLGAFFPWSVLLPESAARAWRRRRSWTRADRMLILWAVVVVLFFSTSKSKLPGYILSAAVPCGILLARVFTRALEDPGGTAAAVLRRGTLILGALSSVAAAFLALNLFQAGLARRLWPVRTAEFRRLEPVFAPVFLTLACLAVLSCALVLVSRSAAARERLRSPAGLFLAAYLLLPLSLVTVLFDPMRGYAEAGSSRDLLEAIGPVPAGIACLECWSPGLPYYAQRTVTLVTLDGHELTSNYAVFLLGRSPVWPEPVVPRSELGAWLSSRRQPVYLLSRRKSRDTLDSLAAATGGEVVALRRGWWGLALPGKESR